MKSLPSHAKTKDSTRPAAALAAAQGVLDANLEAIEEVELERRAVLLSPALELPEERFEALAEIVALASGRRLTTAAIAAAAQVLRETAPPARSATRRSRASTRSRARGDDLPGRLLAASFEARLLDSCAGSQEIARMLGVSRSTIEKLPARAVLALGGPGRGRRYPAWQFEKGSPSRTVPGLAEVLEALEGTPLRKAVWLSLPRAAFDGRAAKDLLREGRVREVLDYTREAAIGL